MNGKDPKPDPVWFQTAVARYEGPLVRYAARLTGDMEMARDVVQDTFLRLCREDPIEIDGRLAPWLFAVCRNRALDVRQKESRMKELHEPSARTYPDGQTDHVAALETQETASHVAAILGRLPANQQEVVRLKFQNGLTYREISHVTNLSVSNVGYLIHTAIRRIRQELIRSSHCGEVDWGRSRTEATGGN